MECVLAQQIKTIVTESVFLVRPQIIENVKILSVNGWVQEVDRVKAGIVS